MGARFPEVDWYCDRCNAYLNVQPGFDDHHYVWKCTAVIKTVFPQTPFMNLKKNSEITVNNRFFPKRTHHLTVIRCWVMRPFCSFMNCGAL